MLQASPEKVYRAFTEAAAMASWLPPYAPPWVRKLMGWCTTPTVPICITASPPHSVARCRSGPFQYRPRVPAVTGRQIEVGFPCLRVEIPEDFAEKYRSLPYIGIIDS